MEKEKKMVAQSETNVTKYSKEEGEGGNKEEENNEEENFRPIRMRKKENSTKLQGFKNQLNEGNEN